MQKSVDCQAVDIAAFVDLNFLCFNRVTFCLSIFGFLFWRVSITKQAMPQVSFLLSLAIEETRCEQGSVFSINRDHFFFLSIKEARVMIIEVPLVLDWALDGRGSFQLVYNRR